MSLKAAAALVGLILSLGLIAAAVGPSVEMGEKRLPEPLSTILYLLGMAGFVLDFIAWMMIASGTL